MSTKSSKSEQLIQSTRDLLGILDKPMDVPVLMARGSFLERLKTFQSSTYFAKPVIISPLICARYGWTNESVDTLRCVSCREVLVVYISPKLPPSRVHKLVRRYRQQLGTAHTDTCPFYSKTSLESEDDEGPEEGLVPQSMIHVVLPSLIRFMEHPSPIVLARERSKKLGHLELPRSPLTESKALLTGAIEKVCQGDDTMKTSALWALFGWEPCEAGIECSLCLVRLALHQSVSEQEQSRPPKRFCPQALHPLQSHKYYCPFVSGFVNGTSKEPKPYWKVLCERIKDDTKEEGEKKLLSPENALEAVKKMFEGVE